MTVAESRELLARRIVEYRSATDGESRGSALALVNEAIDVFAAAVLGEALQPRDAAPELAEAENVLRRSVVNDWYFTRAEAVPIVAEIDRLRALVARQAEEMKAVALMRRAVSRTMEVATDGNLCLPRWGKHTEFLASVRSFMEMTDATARKVGP